MLYARSAQVGRLRIELQDPVPVCVCNACRVAVTSGKNGKQQKEGRDSQLQLHLL